MSLLFSIKARYACENPLVPLAANRKCRHSICLGSIIITMLLLFDPFLQQVVMYPDRLVASDRVGTIVRAQRYQARSYEGLPLPSVVDISMKVIWKANPCRL